MNPPAIALILLHTADILLFNDFLPTIIYKQLRPYKGKIFILPMQGLK